MNLLSLRPPFRAPSHAAVFALMLCLPGWAQAATLNVPSTAYPTIQAAVNAANNGDTVLLADGTYTGSGNADIDLDGKNLTVTSQNGPAVTIINCGGSDSTDGSGNHRGFYLHRGETNAVISGLTIENGNENHYSANNAYGEFGGGIAIAYGSALTLINCAITENTTLDNGAGVYNAGTLNAAGCTFSGNSADGNGDSGGGFYNSGAAILTDCSVTGNAAGYGGGLGNNGMLMLANCAVAGNGAQYIGGGLYNDGGPVTLTNCTVTGNASGAGQGDGISSSDTLTLTDDIVYGDGDGDSDSEIDYEGTQSPAVTFSDIFGGCPGTGNINADPLFVNAPTDLHLTLGSPCLGAGTSTGAPATDKDNVTRPNPPSIGVYELTPPTHILWNNANGTASLWNYDTTVGTFTQNSYGPYPGWSAKAVADGPDGQTRVLWTTTSGVASLWSLNNANGVYTHHEFGPFTGYTASALSVGTDNTTHVLWDNTNGQASVWNYNAAAGTYTHHEYGPYAGWTAKALADGPDGKTRVLWDNANGTASIWSLNNATGVYSQFSFGPFGGWTANSISVGTDNTTHILWTNTNGMASLWNYNTTSGSYTQISYGPFTGWTAKSVTDGSDGKTRALWNNANGQASIWSLNNTTGVYSQFSFGPYSGWTASALSAGL